MKVHPRWDSEEFTKNALQKIKDLVENSSQLASVNPDDYVLRGTGNQYIIGGSDKDDNDLLYHFKVSARFI